MRRIRAAGIAALLSLAAAAPARADATAFIGANTTPANRSVKGLSVGTGLLVLGFEIEYAKTTDDDTVAAPSLTTGTGNILLQTPGSFFGFQPYLTAGAGLYRERISAAPGSIRAWRTDAAFMDIGTPRDYWKASLDLAGVVPNSTSIVRSVIWPGVHIASGVELSDCVVAGAVSIPPGFRAKHAVIVPAEVARSDDFATINGSLALFGL